MEQESKFDPERLHYLLSDEAGMEKSPPLAELLNRQDILGVAHLGGRQIGRKLAMQRLFGELGVAGEGAFTSNTYARRKGNFMLNNPPIKRDPDSNVELSYETQVMIAETMPAMVFPHWEGKAVFTSFPDYREYCAKVMIWWAKTKLDEQIREAVWGLETRERGGTHTLEVLSQSLAPASDDLPQAPSRGRKFYDHHYRGKRR
jgi:hypothetical protein